MAEDAGREAETPEPLVSAGASPEGPGAAPRPANPVRTGPNRKAPPKPVSKSAKSDQAFADKARDLDALRATVVDAAGVGAGLWFSYIFVLLYLFVAVGSVTHKDLLFQSPIKLPFLNIELPLLGFFALAPMLFLIVHGYVLLHFVLLAGKTGAFHTELEERLKDHDTRTDLRRQLPSNLFVQILAGSGEVRKGVVGLLMRLVAQISLVAAPVALLSFFLLQFLPYHHPWITWWHRFAIVADLLLLWLLWPSVARGRLTRLRDLWLSGWAALMAAMSLFITAAAFSVATFPGEFLHGYRKPFTFPVGWDDEGDRVWSSLHELLIDGEIDWAARAPKSPWSNRIVLPDLDAIDRTKFDTEEKILAASETVSLRKRHLEGAVLIGAKLRKADLTGSFLQGAQLDNADLRGVKFECGRKWDDCTQLQGASLNEAYLQGALLDGAQLQKASLIRAQLQGVSLNDAQLQGASLIQGRLQGASLFRTRLQGASLDDAQFQGALLDAAALDGASLNNAQLQGASLIAAQLKGASLNRAQLQGALLNSTELQCAILDDAQLQGASLNGAQLQGASLNNTLLQGTSFAETEIWRSDFRGAVPILTFVTGAWRAMTPELFDELKTTIQNDILNDDHRKMVLERIESRLNPATAVSNEASMEEAWSKLEASPPEPNAFMKAITKTWRMIGCDISSAPFVLRRHIQQTRWAIYSGSYSDVLASGNAENALIKQHLTTLADHFLKDECAGAKGLTEEERAFLKDKAWNRPEGKVR